MEHKVCWGRRVYQERMEYKDQWDLKGLQPRLVQMVHKDPLVLKGHKEALAQMVPLDQWDRKVLQVLQE